MPAPEALPIELLLEELGEVLDELGEVLLDDELLLGEVLPVALVSLVLLPVVPDVEPGIEEPLAEPIMAFVGV